MRAYASERGVALVVRRFPATTRTAQDAAREIGTTVERIVKSLVFVAGERAVVALCSGAARVDETRLATVIGVPSVRRATAEEAKRWTGYAIGGVPPFAHATTTATFIDRDLLDYETVWAAAGTPRHVFAIAPADLVRVAGAAVTDLRAT